MSDNEDDTTQQKPSTPCLRIIFLVLVILGGVGFAMGIAGAFLSGACGSRGCTQQGNTGNSALLGVGFTLFGIGVVAGIVWWAMSCKCCACYRKRICCCC